MKGYPDIYWPEQCKYCKRLQIEDLNSELGKIISKDCTRNKIFIEKLRGEYFDYLGTLDFRCDYFVLDEDKYNEFKKLACVGCNSSAS